MRRIVQALFLTLLGLFGIKIFDSAAHLGETRLTFWVGAILTFLCLIAAFGLIIKSFKEVKNSRLKMTAQLLVVAFTVYTFIKASLVLFVWNFKDFSF